MSVRSCAYWTRPSAVTPNLFAFSGRRDDTQVTFSTTRGTAQEVAF